MAAFFFPGISAFKGHGVDPLHEIFGRRVHIVQMLLNIGVQHVKMAQKMLDHDESLPRNLILDAPDPVPQAFHKNLDLRAILDIKSLSS